MTILTLVFAVWIQISFTFNKRLLSNPKLVQNTILVNKNDKFYNFSISFMNYETAIYYSNKVYIDNILLNKGECKVNNKNVECFVDENIFNNNIFSNYVKIRLGNLKKIINAKKLYYTLETLNNKLIFNIFSNDKYYIKVLNKKIQPINNLSKFEIDISNIDKIIEIDLYDEINSKKIGEIKEKLKSNYLRFLQDTNECALTDDQIQIDLSGKIVDDMNIDVTLNSNNNSITINNTSLIDENILYITIPKNIESGNYYLQIFSNNIKIYSQNIEIKYKVIIKENLFYITYFNISEPLPLSNSTLVDKSQKLFIEDIEGNRNYLDIDIYSNIHIKNISISNPMLSYQLFAEDLCNQTNSYFLADLYVLPKILKISNGLIFNESTTVTFTLVGTYEKDAIYYIEIANYRWHNISIAKNKSQIFRVNSSDIIYLDKTDKNFTINATFDLTNSTLIEGKYEIEFNIKDEEIALQHKIPLYIIKCDPPEFPNEDISKCVSCKDLNKYLSSDQLNCVSSCETNEYLYDNICYDECPQNTKVYKSKQMCLVSCENDLYDIKEENKECVNKTFELEKIDPLTLNISDNQEINLIFKENFPPIRLINISIGDYYNEKCSYNNNNKFSCKINLSSFNNPVNEYSIYYQIKKGNNDTLILNSGDIKVKINLKQEICNNFYQYYDAENKDCKQCTNNYYYYNNSCKDCNSLRYFLLEINSNYLCNETCSNLKEYHEDINQTYCVEKCSDGYGFIDSNNLDKCIICPDKRMIQDKDQICICDPSKYKYDSKTHSCIECSSISEGMILKDGECICDPTKYELNSNGGCTLCSLTPGMIASNGKCICDPSQAEFNRTGKNECEICSSISEGMNAVNGKCVCDPTLYEYNYYNDGKCVLCSSIHKDMIANNGKCKCKNGTIQENDNDKIICVKVKSCKIDNFCKNGNCDDSSGRIICNCNYGFFGVDCDEEINEVNYEETMSKMNNEISEIITSIDSNNNNTANLVSNDLLTNKIKQVSILYKNSLNKINTSKSDIPIYNTIKYLTKRIINSCINDTEPIENFTALIEYIGFVLYYEKYSSNNRRLSEDNIISNEDFVSLSQKINITNLQNNKLVSSINEAFSYILWDINSTNYDEYIQLMKNNKLPYLFKDGNIQEGDSILHIIINSSVTSENESDKILSALYRKNNIKKINNVNYVIDYDSFNEVNELLYSYYWENGINIYNNNDDAFTDKCYRNKKLKYDLNTEYKKYFLYQGSIIQSSCNLSDNFNNEVKLYYTCDSETSFNYSFIKDSSILKLKDKYSLLPLKCLNKIKELYNNLGFWIFILLIIIFILITILHLKEDKEFVGIYLNYDILENDNLNIETTDDNIIIYRDDFSDNLIFKLLNFHPITSLSKVSLLIPIIFKYWLLIFNISMLFGFNALLCTEKYIEKRIYDKHRNNFAYPMRKEFGKIISSILLTMILTFLVKLLNMTSLENKRDLELSLMKNREKERFVGESFMKEKLFFRLIAFSIMSILIIFMFIYSIGFCYIYFNSQINLLYSFIWSVFWLWIFFAPLIICISCVVEYFLIQDNVTKKKFNYYSNLLYCF